MNRQSKYEILFSGGEISEVLDFLDQNAGLDISQLVDDKKNTLLHTTAFQNRFDLMKTFISYLTKFFENQYSRQLLNVRKPIRNSIENWLNQGNVEGFTSIHYACYKGNLQMVHFLQNAGGNLFLQTKLGLNCLHLATQGDRINIVLYLYDKFSLNCLDLRKGTPLHWACYTGSQNIAAFLLAQPTVEIDSFDEQQQTPLHLATQYGNTKIVKRLLMKGADRTLRNRKGQTPIQIAQQNDFQNIVRLLNDKFSFLDKIRFFCNLKNVYQPTKRSISKSLVYLTLILFIVITTHTLVKPSFPQAYLIIPIIYYLIYLGLYFSLIISPKGPQKSYQYKDFIHKKQSICFECKIPKPSRTQHCDTCKVCIRMFDHHCFWINNCVGRHNLIRFIIFLIMTIIMLLQTAFISFVVLTQKSEYFGNYRFGNDKQWGDKLVIVALLINIIVDVLLIFPIIILLYVQLTNLLMNQTTHERFSKPKHIYKDTIQQMKKKKKGSLTKQSLLLQKKKDKKYSLQNCAILCYGQEEVRNEYIKPVQQQSYEEQSGSVPT